MTSRPQSKRTGSLQKATRAKTSSTQLLPPEVEREATESPALEANTQDESKNRQAWEAGLKQLVQLTKATLAFLACVLKQDKIPLTSTLILEGRQTSTQEQASLIGTESSNLEGEKWNNFRRQLDSVFRDLARWKKTIKDDELELIDNHRLLVGDVNSVSRSLLKVAHHLTHIVDSKSPSLDKELREMDEQLHRKITEMENGPVGSTSPKTSCDYCGGTKTTSTQKTAYLESLKGAIKILNQESDPLQLVLRRRDWMRKAVRTREQEDDGKEEEQRIHKKPTMQRTTSIPAS